MRKIKQVGGHVVKKLSRFILLALLSTMLISCSNLKANSSTPAPSSTPESKTEKATEQPKAESEQQTKMKELEKYNAYVGLNNVMVGRMHEVLVEYFEEIGMEAEPIIDEHFSYTMLSVSSYDKSDVEKYLAYTDQKPEFAQLDPIVVKLKPVINELISVMGEAHEYYEIKGYVDDKFAKSKELHTKLVNTYKTYETISNEFFDALDVLDKERTKAELKDLQDADKMLRYSTIKTLLDAEEVAKEFEAQGITAKNIIELDLEKFKVKYDVLVEDLKALTEYSQDAARVKKEGFDSYTLERYVDKIKELKVAATNVIDRVNKKKKVDDFHLDSSFFTENQEGTPENFHKHLGEAIDSYNTMNNLK
jgi:Protein of unknown function (DUF3829)